jgi:acetoin utilization deacetylase AcuC-like enzyme
VPLTIFYCERLVADAASYSPSAMKPRAVVASWQQVSGELRLLEPKPITIDQFCLAHDRTYVEDVLACRRDNGFGNRLPAVAASLPYTSGAMLAAARVALDEGVAVAPVSGFHHAHFDHGGGFCTFNGLVIAARVLQREGCVRRVGILDADHHYGDGTVDILRTLSLEAIEHVTLGAHFEVPADAPRFFAELPAILERFRACDLLLYQAGADPHVDDPLGGWLTTEELRQRDRIVFRWCHEHRLPVAWNLAGGYQTPLARVLAIHDNTLRECLAALPDRESTASGTG